MYEIYFDIEIVLEYVSNLHDTVMVITKSLDFKYSYLHIIL